MRLDGLSSECSVRERAKPVRVSPEYNKGVKFYGWVTNIIFSWTWGKIHFYGLICGRKNEIAHIRFQVHEIVFYALKWVRKKLSYTFYRANTVKNVANDGNEMS